MGAPGAEGVALDVLIKDIDLWNSPPEAFMQRYASLGFQWLSGERGIARMRRADVTLFGLEVVEADVLFDDKTVRQFLCNAYTRGDRGPMDKEAFGVELNQWKSALMNATKTRPTEEKPVFVSTGVKQKIFVWRAHSGDLRLLYSYSTKDKEGRLTFRPEFIRVTWEPPTAQHTALTPLTPRRQAPTDNASTDPLTRRENGDTFLDGIPMVDQGDKGYCAVATAERVMRYYQLDVDQHQIAQLASSSAAEGTSPEAMVKALKRAGVKLGCRIRVIEDLDIKEVLDRIRRYNKEAKRAQQPEIVTGRMIDVGAVYRDMHFDTLKASRLNQRVQFSQFKSAITRYIEQGTPLAWSVILGKVNESPPLSDVFGGHMRLIIGYNTQTDELLYSDSWGAGHECKRMAYADAWAVTTGLYAIEKR